MNVSDMKSRTKMVPWPSFRRSQRTARSWMYEFGSTLSSARLCFSLYTQTLTSCQRRKHKARMRKLSRSIRKEVTSRWIWCQRISWSCCLVVWSLLCWTFARVPDDWRISAGDHEGRQGSHVKRVMRQRLCPEWDADTLETSCWRGVKEFSRCVNLFNEFKTARPNVQEVGLYPHHKRPECVVQWKMNEFTDLGNQWVYVPVHRAITQQCVEWPEAPESSWERQAQRLQVRTMICNCKRQYCVSFLLCCTRATSASAERAHKCWVSFSPCFQFDDNAHALAQDIEHPILPALSHGKESSQCCHIWTPRYTRTPRSRTITSRVKSLVGQSNNYSQFFRL